MYRCFENVIRNAVRYTRPETTVQVSTRLSADAQQLCVRITDQGPGVDESRLQSIFEPFERGSDDTSVGFGLGLAIAYSALEMHQGSIVARNEQRGGLTVEICLPRARSLREITLA